MVAGFQRKRAPPNGSYIALPGSGLANFPVTTGAQPGGAGQLPSSFAWSGLSANEMAYVASRQAVEGQTFAAPPQELHRGGAQPGSAPPPLSAMLPAAVPLPDNSRSCFTQTSPKTEYTADVALSSPEAGAPAPPPSQQAGSAAPAVREGSRSPSPQLLHNPLLRDGNGATSFGA